MQLTGPSNQDAGRESRGSLNRHGAHAVGLLCGEATSVGHRHKHSR